MTRYAIALSLLNDRYPDLTAILDPVNKALRNINRGKMDYLPYSTPVPPFKWYMEALLTPQGENRPPAIGHWQLRLVSDQDGEILLQGKVQGEEEQGILIFHCPSSAWEQSLASSGLLAE
jgi:hypothetical protein